MHDINQSGINLNDDLEKISNRAFQWKVSFNPGINKQAQVSSSRRLQKLNHSSLTFKGTSVTQSEIQKHLRMFLDSKIDFKEHIQYVFNKVYKSFVRPHLDYGDIIKPITFPFIRK